MASVFADIKTPFINQLTAKRILSDAVKENIFQGVIFKPEEAVTEKYSEDTDAAEIQVLRVKPTPNDAREIGTDTNGGWFNEEKAATSSTEAYGIQIIQTIDRQIDIPTNAQDMVNVDLLAAETRNLGGLVNRNINAMSLAAMLATNFNSVAGVKKRNGNEAATEITPMESNWITHAVGVGRESFTDTIIDAGAKLDEGNEEQGIDAYPDDMRAVIIRPQFKAGLLKNMTGLYGGTSVFEVLKKNGLDTETTPAVATTGYVGEIANMPVYVGANIMWALTEKYLGLAPKALDKLIGVAVSGYGTGRALAFNSKIKTIDCPDGQGMRLQPKYRFGAECWDGAAIVPIFASEFTNPVTGTPNALFMRGTASRA